MAATAVARSRSRAVNLDTSDMTDAERMQMMKTTLAEIRKQQCIESAARSQVGKLTKKLEADMTAAKIKKIETIYDGKRVLGVIGYGDPRNVINVTKLFAKLTREQFLSVVTAAAGTVKDAFGTHIANACLDEKQGEYKLRIEAEK